MEADKKTTTEELGFFKKYGFYLALAVLAVIVMLPNPEGLSVAGQRMIGIMVFSVIVWATTAISYPVSAGVIMTLMALLIGFSPNPETGKLFGTAAGLGIGLKGFASTAFCLVAAAMFLAVAMTKTGLDKRIALVILSKLGAKSNRVVIGVIQRQPGFGAAGLGGEFGQGRGLAKACRPADQRQAPGQPGPGQQPRRQPRARHAIAAQLGDVELGGKQGIERAVGHCG